MSDFFFSFSYVSTSISIYVYSNVDIKCRYIERIAIVSSGGDESTLSSGEIVEWIYKIQKWNPKYFTLSHIPSKYRLSVSKFLRRVIIARMADCPELASAYHRKLKEAYETEDKLRDAETLRRSEEHLEMILDEAERKLGQGTYLVGDEFSLADVAFIPLLSRLVVLNLGDKYIDMRPNVAEYWNLVQKRPSYRKVIGRHFDGWRRHKTLFKIWCFVQIRSLFKQY